MNFFSRLFAKSPAPAEESAPGEVPENEMVSLVVLTPGWDELSADAVRDLLNEIFPGSYLPPREEGNFVVEGPVSGASVMVQCVEEGYSGLFMVQSVPGPYTEFSSYLEHVEDSDLKHSLQEQPCWMSVDMLHCQTTEDDAYRFIGAVLAKLAPEDTSYLVDPRRMLVVPFSGEVRRRLAAGAAAFGMA